MIDDKLSAFQVLVRVPVTIVHIFFSTLFKEYCVKGWNTIFFHKGFLHLAPTEFQAFLLHVCLTLGSRNKTGWSLSKYASFLDLDTYRNAQL